ncbi:MAG: chromate transporter [Anaeroplasma sp.]
MLIFLWLFLEFFKIGICAFGGGLATIPFLEELATARPDWFTHEELINMIAVSESTPGAIGINMATYVGFEAVSKAFNGNPFMGFLGGLTATFGFVSPSIIIIIIVSQFLSKFKNSKVVKWAFYGLRAASIGLIIAAAFSILKVSIINIDAFTACFSGINTANFFKDIWLALSNALVALFDYKALALAVILGILIFKYKKHPILYIALAAVIGIIFQM